MKHAIECLHRLADLGTVIDRSDPIEWFLHAYGSTELEGDSVPLWGMVEHASKIAYDLHYNGMTLDANAPEPAAVRALRGIIKNASRCRILGAPQVDGVAWSQIEAARAALALSPRTEGGAQ